VNGKDLGLISLFSLMLATALLFSVAHLGMGFFIGVTLGIAIGLMVDWLMGYLLRSVSDAQ
jgi:ABC-type nitrate/sulfonate/bicarbonate transport system permease component